MADYDSDSSGAEDLETNVFLGYASKDSAGDGFSQLGGYPSWLVDGNTPSGSLAKCRVCNGLMNLLLQINGDLPEKIPGHERRLYIFACRRKPCRRKDGSVRGIRATKQTTVQTPDASTRVAKPEIPSEPPTSGQPPVNLGETLFGVKPNASSNANPFAASSSGGDGGSGGGLSSNPFAGVASSLGAKPAQKPTTVETLPETFAAKARISIPQETTPTSGPVPYEPWPEPTAFPEPFPTYHLDADKEYIDAEPESTPAGVRVEDGGAESASDDKAAFESSMDKTFQRFADRLAQNPEQVLRYEHGGQPLLYSKSDAVGKLLSPPAAQGNSGGGKVAIAAGSASSGSRMPRCANCGAARVFELQLTPHAITELEVEEMSVDGMDWGTVILGVCGQDCMERGKGDGEVGYIEEWTGVQWEEIAGSKPGP